MLKKQIGTAKLDPTIQADDLMGDTSGLTGITVNKTQSENAQGSGSVANAKTGIPEPSEQSARYRSEVMENRAGDVASEDDDNAVQQDNETRLSTESDDTMPHLMAPPSVVGEQSVSGDMPHPESDDDTLQNAQDMGMQLGEDTEHPKEVSIARDVDRAERALAEG